MRLLEAGNQTTLSKQSPAISRENAALLAHPVGSQVGQVIREGLSHGRSLW